MFTPNMEGLNTFLISIGTITLVSLSITWYGNYKKRTVERVLSSTDRSWKNVAKVRQLFYYPSKTGKAIAIKECYFSEHGIFVKKENHPMADRMFIAFDEVTKKFITARTHPTLLQVKYAFLTKNRVKFEAANMPILEFELPDLKAKSISLIKWYGENITGVDCGSEASKWLSQYLNKSNSGVRLAMRAPDEYRNIINGAWKSHAKFSTSMRNEDSGLFSELAISYVLVSVESVNDLNERLEKPIRPVQLRFNVVVEGCEPHDENYWEWIKIGDTAIIRRLKFCTRCLMTRIDPDTGVPDPKNESVETLRTCCKLSDPRVNKPKSYSPTIGFYYGLHCTGNVRLDDDLFVYVG